MWPSSASLAPSVMPRIAFRPARAVRLVVLGWTVTVTDIRLLYVSCGAINLRTPSIPSRFTGAGPRTPPCCAARRHAPLPGMLSAYHAPWVCPLECPLIAYTDLNDLFCKAFKATTSRRPSKEKATFTMKPNVGVEPPPRREAPRVPASDAAGSRLERRVRLQHGPARQSPLWSDRL